MKKIFKDYLFNKHIFVYEDETHENALETLCALANLFGIRILSGYEFAEKAMIEQASRSIGINVPKPFYEGFPESVKQLTSDQLLFDQLLHYYKTYGMGYFDQAGHSVLENTIERICFKEKTQPKDFDIASVREAEVLLKETVTGLLSSTRPLSFAQFEVVVEYTREYGYRPEKIASKNTCIKLLCNTRDIYYSTFLTINDVIKLLDEISFSIYRNENIKKLNLKNTDRKLIAAVIDEITGRERFDISGCYEKKKVWCGLLHHIHYKAKNENGQLLLEAMRGDKNCSAYSAFEKKLAAGDAVGAAATLKELKGSAGMMRHLDHIVSRCASADEVRSVMKMADTGNNIVLLQLLVRYENELNRKYVQKRIFKFTKHDMLKVHIETKEEESRRRSQIKREYAALLWNTVKTNLEDNLKGKLGTVYIDPDMKNYALPLQENTSSGGFGVLARGSRIHIEDAKKLRAFTYWEKVNDIDLSVFGIDSYGRQEEFSWRTMAGKQSAEIVYSGDETSGYNGGSEYFDIDTELFKLKHPDTEYLIFCDNVFSGSPFSGCFCRAGYMNRDKADSGEIYEPKTVETAFTVNCNSTACYLFAIDLKKNDLIWLNMAKSGADRVAGETSLSFLTDYFNVTDTINVRSFFEMMASAVTDDPESADIIVSNKALKVRDGATLIREYDFEKMLAFMNGK